jgi:hypothetical protein
MPVKAVNQQRRGGPLKSDLPLRLILVEPPAGVDFGIQHGHGADYATLFVQQRERPAIVFDFTVTVANNRKDGLPNFQGPFVQGQPGSRFIYIDVGTCAGQKNTPWSRRMKVPLQGITWPQIEKVLSDPVSRLSSKIPGTGKGGGPNCATVELSGGWVITRSQ